MFDTVAGLPVHALVVHGVVVLLPLAALLTVLVAPVAATRRRLALGVVLLNAGVTGMTLAARLSGEQLRERLGGGGADVATHADWGEDLVWFALGLLVVSLLVVLMPAGRQAPRMVGVALALVAAGATAWWTFRTGHTGSSAVWADIVKNTSR